MVSNILTSGLWQRNLEFKASLGLYNNKYKQIKDHILTWERFVRKDIYNYKIILQGNFMAI